MNGRRPDRLRYAVDLRGTAQRQGGDHTADEASSSQPSGAPTRATA